MSERVAAPEPTPPAKAPPRPSRASSAINGPQAALAGAATAVLGLQAMIGNRAVVKLLGAGTPAVSPQTHALQRRWDTTSESVGSEAIEEWRTGEGDDPDAGNDGLVWQRVHDGQWLYRCKGSGGQGEDWSDWKTQLKWSEEGRRTPRRVSNSYLEAAPVKHGLGPVETLGDELADMIATSPISIWTGPARKAAGNVFVHPELVYEAMAVEYLERGLEKPVRDETEPNALVMGAYRQSGRRLGEAGQVHLSERRGLERSTALHESVHLYSANRLHDALGGFWSNEGATEFFTLMVCKAKGIPRESSDYTAAERAVAALVAWLDGRGHDGKVLLAGAYFQGQTEPLLAAMASKGWPTGTSEVSTPVQWWRNLVGKEKYAEAASFLDHVDELAGIENTSEDDSPAATLIEYWNKGNGQLSDEDIAALLKAEKKDEVIAAVTSQKDRTTNYDGLMDKLNTVAIEWAS